MKNITVLVLVCVLVSCSKPDGPAEEVPIIEDYFDGWCSWSPDGRYLMFFHAAVTPEESARCGAQSIWAYDFQERKYGFFMGPGEFPEWSPDGQILAFHYGGQIFFYYPAARSVRQVTRQSDIFTYSWSWDGSRLLVPWSGGCWLVDTLGNFYRNISPDSSEGFWSTIQGADWTDEANAILLSRRDATANVSLIVVDTLGHIIRELYRSETEWEFASHPAWSPSGFLLAIDLKAAYDALAVFTSSGHFIYSLGDSIGMPEWSPDGSRLAYQKYTWRAPSPYPEFEPDIGRITLWLCQANGTYKYELLGWPPQGYDSTLFDGGYNWVTDTYGP